jgi:hypothetical protein
VRVGKGCNYFIADGVGRRGEGERKCGLKPMVIVCGLAPNHPGQNAGRLHRGLLENMYVQRLARFLKGYREIEIGCRLLYLRVRERLQRG